MGGVAERTRCSCFDPRNRVIARVSRGPKVSGRTRRGNPDRHRGPLWIAALRSLAAEYGPKNIRVNALLPGGTDTPMGQAVASTPETLAFVEELHALKRIARPEEIAQSALYLASDASSFTTGSAMLVDGGVSINRT